MFFKKITLQQESSERYSQAYTGLLHLIWRREGSVCILNDHTPNWRPERWRRVGSIWTNRMCFGTGPRPTSALLNSAQGGSKESEFALLQDWAQMTTHQKCIYMKRRMWLSKSTSWEPAKAPCGQLSHLITPLRCTQHFLGSWEQVSSCESPRMLSKVNLGFPTSLALMA